MPANDTSIPNVMFHHELVAAATPGWFHYTLGIILMVTTVVSIVTNGITSFIFFFKDRKLLTRTNVYIATICILSFVMAVLGIPMVVTSSFNKVWMFGFFGCQYYAFLMSLGGLAQSLMMSAVSFDRYVYVVRHGLSSQLTPLTNFTSILLCCLLALGFALCPLLGWNQYVYDGIGTDCAIDLLGEKNYGKSFLVTLVVVFFIMPVLVMIFSYGTVYAKVLKHSKTFLKTLPQSSDDSNTESDKEMVKKLSREKDLIITICIIVGLFLFCYTPYCTLMVWKIFVTEATLSPRVMVIPSMLTKVSGIFTPFVYLRRNKQFRGHVNSLIPCFRKMTVYPVADRQMAEWKRSESTSKNMEDHGN